MNVFSYTLNFLKTHINNFLKYILIFNWTKKQKGRNKKQLALEWVGRFAPVFQAILSIMPTSFQQEVSFPATVLLYGSDHLGFCFLIPVRASIPHVMQEQLFLQTNSFLRQFFIDKCKTSFFLGENARLASIPHMCLGAGRPAGPSVDVTPQTRRTWPAHFGELTRAFFFCYFPLWFFSKKTTCWIFYEAKYSKTS